jgi:glycosyltransferase involved in cell wall biosynthesis
VHLVEDSSKLQLDDVREPQASSPTTMRGQVIAILLDSAPRTWGSREEMHLRLSQALIARGLRPLLVFSEEIPKELRDRFHANGIEVAPAVNYEKGLFKYYRELGKIIRNYSVTVVHIAFFNYFSLVPWLVRLRGVRYVVYHERNPGVLRAKSWKKRLLQIRGRVVALPMTRVAAISQFVQQQLIEVGVPGRKISLVYNGVDARRYSPDPSAKGRLINEFSIRPDEITLATLSYLDRPHKNIDVVIEACRQLVKRRVAIRLLVIGDGEMRGELEALADKLGIADRIHWLGHIFDPIPILQGCDVFLMVSQGEGFGLALAEAMACGVAAVAARSGALSEIVEDGKSGLLVPPSDASALADAIEKLAKDENLRRKLALNGLERVRHHFTVAASIEEMMRVYESMWSH